ncbi:hypothetical protein XBFM1_2320003 [Xenorhabdus bovienii str. feltiae Moldova]|uniref:Uncharacterized protein n=3 Tax=Xenorhabdus bovienii TaxID=40576 RepID=A0A0B6XE76_XENBV|nr:hypothetical protein XBFM1_2320003 [Xenorhabdus bovienii str. feltiae Moldova]CDM91830.1 protein of unknown function [Xenorhabdus bovienii]
MMTDTWTLLTIGPVLVTRAAPIRPTRGVAIRPVAMRAIANGRNAVAVMSGVHPKIERYAAIQCND